MFGAGVLPQFLHDGRQLRLCPWLASEEVTEHRPFTTIPWADPEELIVFLFISFVRRDHSRTSSCCDEAIPPPLLYACHIFGWRTGSIATNCNRSRLLVPKRTGQEEGRETGDRRQAPGLLADDAVCVDRLTRQSSRRAAKSGPLSGGHLPHRCNRKQPLPFDYLRCSCVADRPLVLIIVSCFLAKCAVPCMSGASGRAALHFSSRRFFDGTEYSSYNSSVAIASQFKYLYNPTNAFSTCPGIRVRMYIKVSRPCTITQRIGDHDLRICSI